MARCLLQLGKQSRVSGQSQVRVGKVDAMESMTQTGVKGNTVPAAKWRIHNQRIDSKMKSSC